MRLQAPGIALFTACVLVAGLAGASEGPRLPSGKPDLSGTFDAATLTPLLRPAQYGDNLYLTPEEAEKLAAEEAATIAERQAASDGDREAPPAGGDGSPGASGNVGGYNTFWIDRGTSAMDVDGKFRTSIIVDPPNGQLPQMTPEGQKMMAELFASFGRQNDGKAYWIDEGDEPGPYDDIEIRDNAERCLMGFSGAAPSIPSLYNNFKRIVHTDEVVMIEIEMVHDARIVRMNSEHEPAHVKSWLGDSIGWWDGDTLVVETTNFSHKTEGFLGGGENTTVTERFSRLDGGDLLYKFTVSDPTIWKDSWSGEYVWRASDQKVYEYACHEGNYAMGNIMRGARLLEREAMESKAKAESDDR